MIVLVIGVALWVGYKLPSLGPLGKVLVGFTVSLALLSGGIFLERRERYRLFGRTGIGGGWAMLFFTTWAMHHVPQARILETQWVDLVLLLGVAAAMVVHTLRYDSQVVTALAFLLAFATVTISHNTVYSLSAGAVLAMALAAIAYRKNWFQLEVFGLLASYLNHFFWQRGIIEPMGAQKHAFPEFMPSAMLLVFYWSVFRASYVLRRLQSTAEENISTVACVLNTSLLLALMKYQAYESRLAFLVLLTLGAMELGLGQLPTTRKRRTAFVLLTTIGATLMVAAIPFKFSGNNISILWLAEAQALFLAGVFTRELVFRYLGQAAAWVAAAHMLFVDGWRVLAHRATASVDERELGLALTFGLAAVVFFADAHWIPRRWLEVGKVEAEKQFLVALSFLGGVLLFVAAWLAFPGAWAAVAWGVAALILTLAAWRFDLAELSYQAHLIALAGFVRALVFNLDETDKVAGVTLRFLTLIILAGVFYASARWGGPRGSQNAATFSAGYTWAASALVAVLAYKELPSAWISVAWAAFGFLLVFLGRSLNRNEVLHQSFVLATAAFSRALFVNLETEASDSPGGITLRALSVLLVAGLLYASSWWASNSRAKHAQIVGPAHTWAASALVALLAYKEMPSAWIAVAWATLAFLLVFLGGSLKRSEFIYQSYVIAAAAFVQALYVNMNMGSERTYGGMTLRLVSVLLVAGLFYASSLWTSSSGVTYADIAGPAYTWLGSTLVSVLMWYELLPINVALGWALFGLLLLEVGMATGYLHLRLQSYVAFASAFLRIFFVNVNGDGVPGQLSPRLVATLPLILIFYYVYWRIRDRSEPGFQTDRLIRAPEAAVWFGSIALATLVRFELPPDWVVAGWSAMVVALLGIALLSGRFVFLHQGLLMGFPIVFRTAFHHFYQPAHDALSWSDSRPVQVGMAVIFLLLALVFAFPLRRKLEGSQTVPPVLAPLLAHPEQVFFFVPVVLTTVLLALDVPKGRVTVAWGVWAVLIFMFALWVRERSFRLTGLGLLLLCVGKIIVLDVWRQEAGDRYVTFIGLGAATLLVSFLYSRFSDTIRRYL